MPKYQVNVPVAGFVVKYVEADNEQKAIEAALQEDVGEEYEEFDMFQHLVEGNVCNAPLNSAEVLLLDDEDADNPDK